MQILLSRNQCTGMFSSAFQKSYDVMLLASVGVLLACCTTSPLSAQSPQELAAAEEQAFREAVVLAAPCVVRIETVGGLELSGEVSAGRGPTSGVIVGADGWILSSSFNFSNRPVSIVVTLEDGRKFAARQIAQDQSRLLTLLKIEAVELPVAQPAPLDQVRVGQWGIALGRTFDVATPNVSVGIVSALGRIWGKALQTDAKISPVNYGGALIDLEGRVLGVLAPLAPDGGDETAGVEWYDSGIGFAIPLADVLPKLDQLKEGKDLFPGLMGVNFRGERGPTEQLVIERVRYRSPAEEAGLKTGDRVTKFNGLSVERYSELRQQLGNKYAGESISLEVVRETKPLTVSMTLIDKLPAYEAGFLGILPKRASPEEVAVRFVYPDSPAAQAGLQAGDVIQTADGQPLKTPADLASVLSHQLPGETFSLTWKRGEQTQTAEITAASLPNTVPESLVSEVFPENAAKPPEGIATGRLTATVPGYERELVAYVPTDYSPDMPCGLIIALATGTDPLDAQTLKAWQVHCDQRNLILVGLSPENRTWQPNDSEYVHNALLWAKQTYSVDPRRVALLAKESSALMAWLLAFRSKENFPAVIVLEGAIPPKAPEGDPNHRQQFYVGWSKADPKGADHREAIEAYKSAKLPITVKEFESLPEIGPGSEEMSEAARWLDSLDRI